MNLANFCAIVFFLIQVTDAGIASTKNDKSSTLHVCIVEGRGTYKKAAQFCPTLEKTSNIECVIGIDKLDCLRRIQKGTADFSVFSSEDLVVAESMYFDILVASEMRFHNTPFEYEIVAIVNDEAGINSVQDLRGAELCHPGHGIQVHWTEILANYFEASIVPRLCEKDLSLIESRLKASSTFFGPSCKAGPWVPDPVLDKKLKLKYPSLCERCYNHCDMGDKHWGRRGPLYCLTGGYGNVAWVRLDDARSHFGFSGLPSETLPQGFSYLCPDGHLQPLSTSSPCVWVAKPWPAVAAQRNKAAQIQTLIDHISHDKDGWQNALLNLLETYHVNVTSLDTTIPIKDYLDQAVGFQSAYSFPSCNPPRAIVYCTESIIEMNKCTWLQDVSAVYGIEPNLQCIRATHSKCFEQIKHNAADVIKVDHDHRVQAERDHELAPLLFEYTTDPQNRYTIVAVVKSRSQFHTLEDLKGKVACLPNFEGAAYLSTIRTLRNLSLTEESCPSSAEIWSFFDHDSCMWLQNGRGQCNDKYRGDVGALRCLAERGDVAFIGLDVFNALRSGHLNASWVKDVPKDNFRLICPYGDQDKDKCFMHWTTREHLMISKHATTIHRNEIYNSLKDMDKLFGKHSKMQIASFTMYGPFDKSNDVLFRDDTDSLKGATELKKVRTPRLLEDIYSEYAVQKCHHLKNSAQNGHFASLILVGILFAIIVFVN